MYRKEKRKVRQKRSSYTDIVEGYVKFTTGTIKKYICMYYDNAF